MVWNAADIQEGMPVFGLDGEQIGLVAHVWLDVGEPPDLQRLGHDAADGLIPIERMTGTGSVRNGCFEIDAMKRNGSSETMCVPFGAVQILFPGQNVTLMYEAHECRRRFEGISPPRALYEVTSRD